VEDTGFSLWYMGTAANKNGVGILINKSLKSGVVDVKRCGDRIILVKLVFGDLVLNVISVYAPQVGHNENTKREFWGGLEAWSHVLRGCMGAMVFKSSPKRRLSVRAPRKGKASCLP
jgi:exonuclease III